MCSAPYFYRTWVCRFRRVDRLLTPAENGSNLPTPKKDSDLICHAWACKSAAGIEPTNSGFRIRWTNNYIWDGYQRRRQEYTGHQVIHSAYFHRKLLFYAWSNNLLKGRSKAGIRKQNNLYIRKMMPLAFRCSRVGLFVYLLTFRHWREKLSPGDGSLRVSCDHNWNWIMTSGSPACRSRTEIFYKLHRYMLRFVKSVLNT